MKSDKITWVLFLALAVHVVLDAYQTHVLLQLGAYEVNPLMTKLIDAVGSTWATLIPKTLFLIMLATLLALRGRKITKKTRKYATAAPQPQPQTTKQALAEIHVAGTCACIRQDKGTGEQPQCNRACRQEASAHV